jgi:succinate dehydrogenase / fumarate reductase cytochrome b subunit
MAATSDAGRAGSGVGSGNQGLGAHVGGGGRWRIWRRGSGVDYRPHRLRALWNSTIGKKYVVAITGVIFAIWVALHMLGNLKEIEGPGHGNPAIDQYARWLRTLLSPALPHDFVLWVIRGILIVSVVLHIVANYQLWQRNRKAKPGAFKGRRLRSTWSARTMTASGIVILAFLVFHILHFTTGTIHPTRMMSGAVYSNMYYAFHLWWLVVIYVVAMALLGAHLFHGLWSAAQTTGVDNPDRNWFW